MLSLFLWPCMQVMVVLPCVTGERYNVPCHNPCSYRQVLLTRVLNNLESYRVRPAVQLSFFLNYLELLFFIYRISKNQSKCSFSVNFYCIININCLKTLFSSFNFFLKTLFSRHLFNWFKSIIYKYCNMLEHECNIRHNNQKWQIFPFITVSISFHRTI